LKGYNNVSPEPSLLQAEQPLFSQPFFIGEVFNRLFWFRLPPATKALRGRPSPRQRAEENEKKEAETGGSG